MTVMRYVNTKTITTNDRKLNFAIKSNFFDKTQYRVW